MVNGTSLQMHCPSFLISGHTFSSRSWGCRNIFISNTITSKLRDIPAKYAGYFEILGENATFSKFYIESPK